MTDEVQGHRGDAAWKEQREAVAQRNADARKRAQGEQKSRDTVVEGKRRDHAQLERDQLRALNERLEKHKARRPDPR